MAGLYLHIPYCVKKCDYCDFVSFPCQNVPQAYVDALLVEIALTSRAGLCHDSIETVFFGGGTPSLLSGEQMRAILRALRDSFPIAGDAEISMEANPGTVSQEKLALYFESGVNRLSVGLQASQEPLLAAIGRIHTYAQFVETLRLACEAGFTNIGADVMHALPSQSQNDYLETLRLVCDANLTHVSSYALTLGEGTKLYADVKKGRTRLPNVDDAADMEDAGIDYLERRGYHRYEISNFARDGFACRHNLNYWMNGIYLGLGVAAHSAVRRSEWTRYANVERVDEYLRLIERKKRPVREIIRLFPADEMFETVMLGLRLVAGVDRAAFCARFGADVTKAYPSAVETLKKRGWLALSDTHLALNRRGLDMQSEAVQLFMD